MTGPAPADGHGSVPVVGVGGPVALPVAGMLRRRLFVSLDLAHTGVLTRTEALPQRAEPTVSGPDVTINRPASPGGTGSFTYVLRPGRHPDLDPALAEDALARRPKDGPGRPGGATGPRRRALSGPGTQWDDGTHRWNMTAEGSNYVLYRGRSGGPLPRHGSVAGPEGSGSVARIDAARLNGAVRDAVVDALTEGVPLTRLRAASDWQSLRSPGVRRPDALGARAQAAAQDADTADRALANAMSDLAAFPGEGAARDGLRGRVAAAGRAADSARARRAALDDDVARAGAGAGADDARPDTITCELDLLVAGLAVLDGGRPRPAPHVDALHRVLRVRLYPGALTVRFEAWVSVLTDDAFVCELGPAAGTVPNRARNFRGGRQGTAVACRPGPDSPAEAAAELLLTTDGTLPGFADGGGRTGRAMGRRAAQHLERSGMYLRAARHVLEDPVAENRLAVHRALAGQDWNGQDGPGGDRGAPPGTALYLDWAVALYTHPGDAPGHDPRSPAAAAFATATSRLPRSLLDAVAAAAALRRGHPMPLQRAWVMPSDTGLRAFADAVRTGRTVHADRFRLERLTGVVEDGGGWPAVLADAQPCEAAGGPCEGRSCPHRAVRAARTCPHPGCAGAARPLVVSRTPTVTEGLLCADCRRMPVVGAPVFPVSHLLATEWAAWIEWHYRRRPDLGRRHG